jgi:hypothetical protein
VISLGWKIVDITPDERALLHAHGLDIASLLTGHGDIDLLQFRPSDA